MNHIRYSLIATALPGDEAQGVERLMALADRACANGDRQLAEELIDRLYSYYDRRQILAARLADSSDPLQKIKR